MTETSKPLSKKRDSRAVSGDIASSPFTPLLTREGDERVQKKAKVDTSNPNVVSVDQCSTAEYILSDAEATGSKIRNGAAQPIHWRER